MKAWITAAFVCALSTAACADAVLMKSGERYIGDVTEEGDSLRVKNTAFPAGVLVKKADVKVVYPKPEAMLEKLKKSLQGAMAKYEEGKKATDPNPFMKTAMEMLFDPELEAQEAAEVYPAEKKQFDGVLTRMHELRKMCRDGQRMDGPAAPEKKQGDPVKPEAPKKADPAKPAPKPAEPKAAGGSDPAAVLETIRTGGPSELSVTLSGLNIPKEERLAAPMMERLKSETDPQAKAALKDALGKYPGYIVVRCAENTLKSKGVTDTFRRDCVDILATKKEDKAISMMSDFAFAAEMRDLREYARGPLAAYGNACLKSTSRYIHVSDARTRTETVDFIAAIGTPEAYGVLAGCLIIGTSKELLAAAGIDVPLRDHVCELMIAGGDTACPALVASLSNGNLRKWSCYCLSKISGEGYAESDVKSWTAWWKKRAAENAGK